MNTLKKLWPYVQFYWRSDDKPLMMMVLFMCFYLALSSVALLVKDWTPVFILLFIVPFSLLLFLPTPDDAERQRVLPCAEFMLSRPVSRRRLYYARLLLIGLYLLPCVVLCGAAGICQPDKIINHSSSVMYTGLMFSGGLALLLVIQCVCLLPLHRKIYQYAPLVLCLTLLCGGQFSIRLLPDPLRVAETFFADWWWLIILSLAAAAALAQWLVCWRLKNLQIA